MRKLTPTLILLLVIYSSCQKSSTAIDKPASAIAEQPKPAAAPAPVASFSIANAYTITGTDKNMREFAPMTIVNTSENGSSYYWDFGTGETSTDKTPENFTLYPCMMNHTVTLTVTNKDGVSSSFSQTFYVQCYKGVPTGRVPANVPAGWPAH